MQQRRTAPTPIDWSQTPATWIALAVALLATSMPQWIAAVGEGKTLAYVAAGAFTLAAAAFAAQAARLDRARRG